MVSRPIAELVLARRELVISHQCVRSILALEARHAVVIAGHAFMQNVRRGHYELGVKQSRACASGMR